MSKNKTKQKRDSKKQRVLSEAQRSSAICSEEGKNIPGNRFSTGLSIVVIILAAVIPFLNIFGNEFISFDDDKMILGSKAIRELNLPGIFEMLYSYVPGKPHVVDFPLQSISWAVNYRFHEYNVWGYHLGNVLLHAITCVLIFLLLKRGPWKKGVPLWAAIVFAVHPVHVESVTWMMGRKDVLSGAFAFSSMIIYSLYVREKKWFLSASWFFCSLILWTAAFLSKPITVVLPVLILIWVLFSEQKQFRKRGVAGLVVFALMALLFAWSQVLVSGERNMITEYTGGSLAFAQFTNGYVLLRYIWILLLPVQLCVRYSVIPPSGFGDPLYMGSWAVVIMIVAIIIISMRRRPGIWFYPAWFLAGLIPVLQFFQIRTIMADRYLYISSLAYCLVLVLTVSYIIDKIFLSERLRESGHKKGTVTALVLIVIVACYSVATLARNTVWRNSETLWSDTIIKNPTDSIALNNLALIKKEHGEISVAEAMFLESIKYSPRYFHPYNNLGVLYATNSRTDESFRMFYTANQLEPGNESILQNLGNSYIDIGDHENAVLCAKELLHINPSHIPAQLTLCKALEYLSRYQEAMPHCEAYAVARPDNLSALWSFAAALFETKHYTEAIVIYSKIIQMKPSMSPAWSAAGLSYYNLGDKENADRMFRQAQIIDPKDKIALRYFNLTSSQNPDIQK